MTWRIPVVPEMSKPSKGKWNRPIVWFIGLLLLFLIFTPTILVIWGDRDYSVWLLLLLISPLLVWFVCWLWVFIWTMNKEVQFKAWEVEKNKIHERWRKWAQRHIAVLASGVRIPDSQDKEEFLQNSAESMVGQAIMFDRDNEYGLQSLKYEVYQELFEHLKALHLNKSDSCIAVLLDVEDEEDFLEQVAELQFFIAEFGWESQFNLNFERLQHNIDIFSMWISEDLQQVSVILSVAVNNSPEDSSFSENISWFIFSSIEWAKEHNVSAKGAIYRPIEFNIESKISIKETIAKFSEYGLDNIALNGLWLSGLSRSENARILESLGRSGFEFSFGDEGMTIYQPNNYIGKIPFNINWLIFSLALDNLVNKPEQMWVVKNITSTWMGRIAQLK